MKDGGEDMMKRQMQLLLISMDDDFVEAVACAIAERSSKAALFAPHSFADTYIRQIQRRVHQIMYRGELQPRTEQHTPGKLRRILWHLVNKKRSHGSQGRYCAVSADG